MWQATQRPVRGCKPTRPACAPRPSTCCSLPLPSQAQQRLEQLTYSVLERFAGAAPGDEPGASQQQQAAAAAGKAGGGGPLLFSSAELAAFAPLVVSTLKAVSASDTAAFRRQLPGLFPALARLVACDHATPDVQRALSDLLAGRVGPLLGGAGVA